MTPTGYLVRVDPPVRYRLNPAYSPFKLLERVEEEVPWRLKIWKSYVLFYAYHQRHKHHRHRVSIYKGIRGSEIQEVELGVRVG